MVAGEKFDLVILGSGSTAFAAALRARELGKTAVMVEERNVGGTCVNRGCLPSKNLIEAARVVHDAAHPRYPGIQPVRLEVDFQRLIQQKDDVVAAYRRKKYENLLGGGLQLKQGHAEFIDSRTVQVGHERLTGKAILIATGSRPVLPEIPGLADVPYLTSDLLTSGESVELTELPRSLIILGGGYVALELGQMFQRLGTQVTIVERSDELFSRSYEPEVGPALRRILTAEGVELLTSARAARVRRQADGVVADLVVSGRSREIRAERLLVATSRRPNTDRIGILSTEVRLGDQGQVLVDEYLRTNVPHIFAAGDVVGSEQGSQMATPVGSQDGGVVAHNALSAEAPRKVNHRVVPRAVFTDPTLAMVGMTELEAIAAGHECWCRTLPLSLVPRAGTIRDERGFVKMIADANTKKVLGATMLANSAAEVIHEAAMGLRFGATLDDFIELIHVYPTMAEALKIVAISHFKDPATLSCCAV
jgi:mercuric reductase